MEAKELKEMYPIYPTVRREAKGIKIVFSTLIRKWHDKKYYLIPLTMEDNNEAKCIHSLHSRVYRYLMLEEPTSKDTVDDEQGWEKTRLRKITN